MKRRLLSQSILFTLLSLVMFQFGAFAKGGNKNSNAKPALEFNSSFYSMAVSSAGCGSTVNVIPTAVCEGDGIPIDMVAINSSYTFNLFMKDPMGGPLRTVTTSNAPGAAGANGQFSTTYIDNGYSIPAGIFSPNPPRYTATYVLVINLQGSPSIACTYNDVVVIKQKPTITPTSYTGCVGAAFTLTPNATYGATPYASATWAGSPATGYTPAPPTGLNPSVSFTAAGPYTFAVTVTDAAGCTANGSHAVTVNTTSVTITCPTPSVCAGSPATLTANATPATATFNWSNSLGTNASVTPTVNNTTAFFVTATDGGCKATDSFTITVLTTPSVAFSNTTICPGGLTGSFTQTSRSPAVAVGGVITWDTPSGAPSASGENGTFTSPNPTSNSTFIYTPTITIGTAPNTCFSTTTVALIVPATMSFTPTTTNTDCSPPNGRIGTGPITGGLSPFSARITPGGETFVAPGTSNPSYAAGQYDIEITDAANCKVTAQVNIQNKTGVQMTSTFTNPSCNGICDGTISGTASNGSLNYTVVVTSGATTVTSTTLTADGPFMFTGLCGLPTPGKTYKVEVTDNGQCKASAQYILIEPGPVVVTATPLLNCNGLGQGVATVSYTGGSPGGIISISPASGTIAQPAAAGVTGTITAMANGNYVVTVTTGACFGTANLTIAQNPVVTGTVTPTAATCSPTPDGKACAVGGGGNGTYSYNWNPGTTQCITGKASGNYTVTITSAGCNVVVSYTIGAPAGGPTIVAGSMKVVGLQDKMCNGYLTFDVIGVAGNTYTTNAGQGTVAGPPTFGPFTNNTPNYTVTLTPICDENTYCARVVDQNQCQANDCWPINVPPTNAAISTTNVSCNPTGGPNTPGRISVSPTNGNPPFRVEIKPVNPAGPTSTGNSIALNATYSLPNITSSGTYDVVVTENNGAGPGVFTQTGIIIISPSAFTIANLNANLSKTDPTCAGNPNGTVVVDLTGIGGSPQYTVTVTCGPYTQVLTGNGGLVTFTNVPGGVATVTLLDATSCKLTGTISLTAPPVLTLTASQNNILLDCFGSTNGTFTATAGGGVAPYTFINNYTGTPATIVDPPTTPPNQYLVGNLGIGVYPVATKDANGCVATTTVTITQPIAVTATIDAANSKTTTSCPLSVDGVIATNVSGGTPQYSIKYSSGNGCTPAPQGPAAGPFTTPACAGTYTITVTDSKGCTALTNLTINPPPSIQVSSTKFDPDCIAGQGLSTNGSFVITATGGNPVPAGYYWGYDSTATSIQNPNTFSVTGLSSGSYVITVTDDLAANCRAGITVFLVGPAPIAGLTQVTTPVSCNPGPSDGTITVTASGGNTGGLLFGLAPAAGTTGTSPYTFSNQAAGNYTVTVYDTKGCGASIPAVIGAATAFTGTLTVQSPISCPGESDGVYTLDLQGGAPPFTLTGNPANLPLPANPAAVGSYSIPNQPAGTIQVSATDTRGCIYPMTATILPKTISVAIPPVSPICDGQTTNITANTPVVTGGNTTTSASYLWAGQAIQSANNQASITVMPRNTSPGTTAQQFTYTVTAYDDAGCPAIQTVQLTVQPPLVITGTNPSPANFCLGGNSTLQLNSIGGDPNVPVKNVTWSDLSTTPPTIRNGNPIQVNPGTQGTFIYTVTVDDNGCSIPATGSVFVTVNPTPTANISQILPQCDALTATLTGTAPNFPGAQYIWSYQLASGATQSFTVNPLPLNLNYIDGPKSNGIATYTIGLRLISSAAQGSCVNNNAGFARVRVIQNPSIEINTSNTNITNITPNAAFSADGTASNDFIDLPSTSTYSWTFGDGTNEDVIEHDNENAHVYSREGDYEVICNIVKITEGIPCYGTDTLIVNVKEVSEVWIPNVFSPNGDKSNDFFQAKVLNIQSYDMIIMDRWGNQVFHTNDIGFEWDGKDLEGKECQMDTYSYIITVSDYRGVKLDPFVGKVSLIR